MQSTPSRHLVGRHLREQQLRAQMVEITRLMYTYRYTVAGDGNISVRLSENEILITPSGLPKGHMKPEDMVVIDLEGNLARRHAHKPSSERRIHLEIYKIRPDVQSVIHAHPAHCIAFSLAGVSLALPLLSEVVITLGSVPTTEYATPTTTEGPEAIRKWFKEFNALILARHGTVTVGQDLMQAYNRLETIEHAAECTFIARQLGQVKPLPPEDVKKLTEIGGQFGLTPKVIDPPEAHCSVHPEECCEGDAPQGRLTEMLQQELKSLLQNSSSAT